MPTQPTAGLLDSLLAEVNVLATRLNRGHDQHLLPSGARSVLQVLGRSGTHTVPEIARERQTSRQNIQTLVNRLRKTGAVQVSANAAHKRSVLVALTDTGRSLVRQIQESEDVFEDHILARLQPEDLESAKAVLRTIRCLLEDQLDQDTRSAMGQTARAVRTPTPTRARTSTAAALDHAGDDAFPVNLL